MVEQNNKTYGLDLKRERLELRGDEHRFGAKSPVCIAAINIGSRRLYLPEGEVQRGKEDFMDCVTRAYTSTMEVC